jgi:hypothetical protein
MKKIAFSLAFFFPILSYSQYGQLTELETALDRADSIYLVKHFPTGAIVIKNENNKQINKPLVNQLHVNNSIIEKLV